MNELIGWLLGSFLVLCGLGYLSSLGYDDFAKNCPANTRPFHVFTGYRGSVSYWVCK